MTLDANVFLSVTMDTLQALNQSCAATAQTITSIMQSEGDTSNCDEDAEAHIRDIDINQLAKSSADCIMVAGVAQEKELMSEAIRERYSAGVARFVAQTNQRADNNDVTAVNKISDVLSSESFSQCYAEAKAKVQLLQTNACQNIIENVDISQQAKAVVKECLIEGLQSNQADNIANLLQGSGGTAGDTKNPCSLTDMAYFIILGGLGVAILVCGIRLYAILTSSEGDSPAIVNIAGNSPPPPPPPTNTV
jgi:hypothetical protein